jgi:hypothetical protein
MFRITCFVDDKELAKILWALKEFRAYNVESVPVVTNAGGEGAPNGARPAKKKMAISVNIPERWVAFAREKNLKVVNADGVREFTAAIGYSTASYTYILQKLRSAGLLVMNAPPGVAPIHITYDVVRDKASVQKALARIAPKIGHPSKANGPVSSASREQAAARFLAWAKENDKRQVTGKEMVAFFATLGIVGGAYHSLRVKLREDKIIVRGSDAAKNDPWRVSQRAVPEISAEAS